MPINKIDFKEYAGGGVPSKSFPIFIEKDRERVSSLNGIER